MRYRTAQHNGGLVPEFGSSAVLTQRVGPVRAAEILLFGARAGLAPR